MDHSATSTNTSRAARLVDFLVEARVSAKLSQAQIGAALGLSQPDISKIERLERRIDAAECFQWLATTSQAAGQDPAHAWNRLYDILKLDVL